LLGRARAIRQGCERGFGMVDDESEAVKHVKVLQSMIDLSAERLEGLRTECVTTERLTQHEIRTLEVSALLRPSSISSPSSSQGKLVKLFSRQLVGRSHLREPHRAPGHGQSLLVQWLKVVGLKQDSVLVRTIVFDLLEIWLIFLLSGCMSTGPES
jgi:hypothetical protein